MPFADAHCHLDFEVFDLDRETLISSCASHDINLLIVPGVARDNWNSVLKLSDEFSAVYPCVGLHPYFLDKHTDSDLVVLEDMLCKNKQIVAVGEIGLDATIDDLDRQVYLLERQIDLANRFHLPVVLHSRNTHNLLLQILKRKPVLNGGLLHGFSGSLEQAKTFWDKGIYLGAGGVISYERAKKTKFTFSQLPLSSVVLETDSPDMPLFGRQGERNSPLSIPLVYKEFCALRTESEADIYRQLWLNVVGLFGIDK